MAKGAMIRRTNSEWAPWATIKSNDKQRARIDTMRAVLCLFEYDGKNPEVVIEPEPKIVQRGIDAVGD